MRGGQHERPATGRPGQPSVLEVRCGFVCSAPSACAGSPAGQPPPGNRSASLSVPYLEDNHYAALCTGLQAPVSLAGSSQWASPPTKSVAAAARRTGDAWMRPAGNRPPPPVGLCG